MKKQKEEKKEKEDWKRGRRTRWRRRLTCVAGVGSLTAPRDQKGNGLLPRGNAAPPATCTRPEGTVHPTTEIPTKSAFAPLCRWGLCRCFPASVEFNG